MNRTWREAFITLRSIEANYIQSLRDMEFFGEHLNNLVEVYEALASMSLSDYDDDFVGFMNFYCDLSRDTLTMSYNAKIMLMTIMQPIKEEVFSYEYDE